MRGRHYGTCARCGKGGLDLNQAHYGTQGVLNEQGAPPATPMHGPCWEAWFEETRGRPPAFKGTRL